MAACELAVFRGQLVAAWSSAEQGASCIGGNAPCNLECDWGAMFDVSIKLDGSQDGSQCKMLRGSHPHHWASLCNGLDAIWGGPLSSWWMAKEKPSLYYMNQRTRLRRAKPCSGEREYIMMASPITPTDSDGGTIKRRDEQKRRRRPQQTLRSALTSLDSSYSTQMHLGCRIRPTHREIRARLRAA